MTAGRSQSRIQVPLFLSSIRRNQLTLHKVKVALTLVHGGAVLHSLVYLPQKVELVHCLILLLYLSSIVM